MLDEGIEKKGSSLRDLVYVLFRRKWIIIGVLLATVIPVTIYMICMPPAYEARSSLLIKPGRENIYVAPVGSPEGTHPPTIVQRVAEVINSEIEILRSQVLIRRVVEQLRVAGLFPDRLPAGSTVADAEDEESLPIEVAVNRALRNLSVERVKGTDVIEVAFRSHDSDIPANFVNTLVDRYLERHLEVHRSTQSYEFFKTQSKQLEQELQTAARRLADFKKKYGIVSFDQLKLLTLEKYADVNAAQKENEAAIKEAQKRIDKLKEDLTKTSEHRYIGQAESTDSPVLQTLKARLAELELEKTDLVQKYKPENYKIVSINEAIDKVRAMLADEEENFHGSVNTGLSGTYQKIESELLMQEANLEAFHSRKTEIERQLIEYGQELARLGRLEPEIQALRRAVSVREQNYKLYQTKFEESRVSDAMDAARMVSVSVLEPATVPLHPIPANKALNILLSLCIAGVAGLGLAFLTEHFDHTFKIPEDIKDNLMVPLLGTIDEDPAAKERGDLESLAISPKPPLDYQILKSNIMMRAGEKGIKMLSICSPTSGEGSSTVALNLAALLAKDSESRLILVDANLRNPSLHSRSKLPTSPGFCEVIHEGTDVHEAIKQSVIPNLFLLTSGISPPNPMAIFESQKLDDLIEVLRKEFDWIIFDCAPIDLYPESTVLSRQLDGLVLVVQAENKGAEVAIRAKENLEQAGAKIVGAVLNRRRHVVPEAIYRRL
jgi:capsular exopolysaccharide synthesis family protein